MSETPTCAESFRFQRSTNRRSFLAFVRGDGSLSSRGMGPLDFHDLCFSDVFFFGGTHEANPPVKAPVLKVCSRETEILEPRDVHHMNYKHKSMKYSI